MGGAAQDRDVPFGLWELDDAGTVIRFEPPRGGESRFRAPEVAGLNFFADLAPDALAEELRGRVAGFAAGQAPVQSFDLTVPSAEGGVRTRVLLGRINGRAAKGAPGSVLVHVRRA
jgi:hypothetical protein